MAVSHNVQLDGVKVQRFKSEYRFIRFWIEGGRDVLMHDLPSGLFMLSLRFNPPSLHYFWGHVKADHISFCIDNQSHETELAN